MKLIAPHPEPNTTTVFLFGSIAHDSIDDVGSGCWSLCSSTRSNRWFQCEASSLSSFPLFPKADEDAENRLFFTSVVVVVVLFAVEETRVAKSASFFTRNIIIVSRIIDPAKVVELLHDEEKKKSRGAVVDEIFFALEDATPLRKEEERSDDMMRFGSDGVCVRA